jgi:putative tryptophan/tyrosine transport system substrate-binding protein
MKRREFITLLGGTAAAWPLAARAQQTKVYRIGALLVGNADVNSFRTELREGQNLIFEFQQGHGGPRS